MERLGFSSHRIPLRPTDPPCPAPTYYILVCPTYGGGELKGAVPKQVIKWLNEPANRAGCLGVIASGNINFGTAYASAGSILSAKLQVPLLYRFELLGTPEDVEFAREGMRSNWEKLKELKRSKG